MTNKLTSKQEFFCKEYLKDLNAKQAAIRAGYSEKTAAVIGQENLNKPYIAEYIAKLKAERSERVQVNSDWVLEQAKKSFEINAKLLYDEEGNAKMVNPTAAAKFLELTGKHVKVKAWEKEQESKVVVRNIMPVPTADSVESWEEAAKANQGKLLSHD